MPAIDISKLANLDEVGVLAADRPRPAGAFAPPAGAFGPPAGAFGPAAGAFAPPAQAAAPPLQSFAPAAQASAPLAHAFAPPAHAFAPPDEDVDQPLGVERSTRAIRIESEWQQERSAKQAAPVAPDPKPRRPIGGVVLALGLIAAVVVGLVVIVRQKRAPQASHGSGSGVSIQIVAHDATDVMIDGHAAGKTPLTLQRQRGTQPILIGAPHATKQIIPDHDQVVDLSPP